MNLPPELEALVQQKVQAGQYSNPAQVMREALRLLDERDQQQRLKDAIGIGLAQIERGETTPLTPELLEQIDREADAAILQGKKPNPDVCP